MYRRRHSAAEKVKRQVMTESECEQLERANERLKADRSEVAMRREGERKREKQKSISFKPETLELAKQRDAEAPPAPGYDTSHHRTSPVPGPPVQVKDHKNGIMPQTMTNVHDVTRVRTSIDIRHLPLGFSEDPEDSGYLPGLEPLSEKPIVRSLPLILFDAGGGESLAQGNGAPVPLRLFVDILLCLPPEIRRNVGPQKVFVTLRQLRDAIWPNGWQRGRDYPKLVRAMNYLTTSGVPWKGGIWRPITVRNVPVELDDKAIFEVELPPGSGRGPLVSRPAAHQLGLISAPAYRLYLNLTGYWDQFGTYNGHLIGPTIRMVRRNKARHLIDARGQIVTENGKPARRASHPRAVELVDAAGTPLRERNPAVTKYPSITLDQLARMAYAEHDLYNGIRRMRKETHDKALPKVLEVTGATVEVVADHPEGRRNTIRVLPPEKHKIVHEALMNWHGGDLPPEAR